MKKYKVTLTKETRICAANTPDLVSYLKTHFDGFEFRVKPLFKIGDVVRIKNINEVYSYTAQEYVGKIGTVFLAREANKNTPYPYSIKFLTPGGDKEVKEYDFKEDELELIQ